MGVYALQAITVESDSAAFGTYALGATTAPGNSGFGNRAAQNNTTGSNNTAIGNQALYTNTTPSNNVAVGYQALYNANGGSNTAVGRLAGTAVTTGGLNALFGLNAGIGLTTGQCNTIIGESAGYYVTTLTTGQGNTLIGYGASTSTAGGVDQIVLAAGTVGIAGQGGSYVTIGSSGGKIYNQFTVNATWTQTSDGRLKTNIQDDSLGLSFINRLRPVKFNWKPSNEIDPSLPYYKKINERNIDTVIHGLIAQEVKAALDAEGVNTFAGWDEGPDSIQAISREMFVSPLIKAIQELSAQVETLKSEIALLKGA